MVHPLGSCNSEMKRCETFFIFKWKEMSPKCEVWAKKRTPTNTSLCLNAYTCYKLHQWDHQHPQTFTEKDTQFYKVNYVCFRQKHHVVPTEATCGFEMKHLEIFSCKAVSLIYVLHKQNWHKLTIMCTIMEHEGSPRLQQTSQCPRSSVTSTRKQ